MDRGICNMRRMGWFFQSLESLIRYLDVAEFPVADRDRN